MRTALAAPQAEAAEGAQNTVSTGPALTITGLNDACPVPLFGTLKFAAAFHDFADADGDVDFGQEFDASISAPINQNVSLELKAAAFDGDGAFADRTKIWMSVEYRY